MSLGQLRGDISTLAVHHGAISTALDSSAMNSVRLDTMATEIEELRKEKKVSQDVQEAIIKLQDQLEEIRNIYVKRVDGLEREIVNIKLYVSQFVKEMEKKYPVELEDE